MGVTFVFIGYLIVLTIVTTPIALFLGAQQWIRSDLGRINRISKTYITAYAWFITWVICIGVVSGIEGRDIGFGDYWARRISSELSVCAIDVPESMALCKGNSVIPGERFEIQNGEILIQDRGSKYCIDLSGNRVQCKQAQDTLTMTTPYEYYFEDATYAFMQSAVLAILSLLLVSFLIWSKNWRKIAVQKSLSTWMKLRRYANAPNE